MNKNNPKVVQLHQQIEEINQTTPKVVTEEFPGFSDRLNKLIDLTDLGIPPLDGGRQAHIASLLQSSKMAPGDWLKKDKPPKNSTLKRLVNYLLSHIDGSHSPLKIQAWLKFGDEAVNDPFCDPQPDNQYLIPLATALIVAVTRENGIPASEYELSRVLCETVEMLAGFNLTHESMIEPVHLQIIYQYIKSHPRK